MPYASTGPGRAGGLGMRAVPIRSPPAPPPPPRLPSDALRLRLTPAPPPPRSASTSASASVSASALTSASSFDLGLDLATASSSASLRRSAAWPARGPASILAVHLHTHARGWCTRQHASAGAGQEGAARISSMRARAAHLRSASPRVLVRRLEPPTPSTRELQEDVVVGRRVTGVAGGHASHASAGGSAPPRAPTKHRSSRVRPARAGRFGRALGTMRCVKGGHGTAWGAWAWGGIVRWVVVAWCPERD